MSTEADTKATTVERGSAEGVAWTFSEGSNLKPTLVGFKHSPLGDHEVRVRVLYFGVGDQNLPSKSKSQTKRNGH